MPANNHEILLSEAEAKIVEYYLEIDYTGKFVHPPGASAAHLPTKSPERLRVEDEELYEFISCAYKVKLPRKVLSPGHRAPFDFVSDLFFERVKNALGFANRNGGKTMDVAVLNHLDMLFKGGCEVASAGATLDQANKCYRYFVGFCRAEWFKNFCAKYQDVMGTAFVQKALQSQTKFASGAELEVITGSDKGLRSPHPHKARIDEIDLIEWDTLQTGLSMARSDPGWEKDGNLPVGQRRVRGQNTFTSTRQKTNGSMQKMLDTAGEKGIAVYEWDIWEALEKCPRRCIADPKHGDCPIYIYCKGRAHHCAGFYSIDDFIDKVRLIDRTTFETEWENKRPSRHKQVYHQFDNTKHIMTPDRLFKMTGLTYPSAHWHRLAGLDFGSAPGHPFVYLKFIQLPTGQWLQIWEYVAEQRLLRDHAASIKNSPFYLRGERIYADWDAQDRLELSQEHNIRTQAAKKDVRTGIDFIGSLLSGFPPSEEPQLYVWYECTYTIGEYGAYSWPALPGGKVDKSGNPKKEDDHCMDATRYALFSDKKTSHTKYRSFNTPGI